MDVVRRQVEDLHGTVEIESTEGAGTTVELRLPLSLSVIEGFWVDVAGTEYVLPLDDVIECLELPPDRRAVAGARGDHQPARRTARIRPPARPAGRERQAAHASTQIVVVRYRSGRVALGVDAILGERQTVIKPLGRLFRSVAGHLRFDDAARRRCGVRHRRRPAAAAVARQGARVGLLSETTAIRGPGGTLKGSRGHDEQRDEMRSVAARLSLLVLAGDGGRRRGRR